jgi:hypothetical protein
MWWGIGFGGGILYLLLLFTLGFMTLRKGHWNDVHLRDRLPPLLAHRRLDSSNDGRTGLVR